MKTDLERLQAQYKDILLAPVDALEFTIRTTNCFATEGIKCVGDLVQRTEVELFRMPGIGKKSLTEVKEVLANYNLSLNTKILEWPVPSDAEPQIIFPSVTQSVRQSLNYTLRVAADQAHSNCVNNDPEKAQMFVNILVDILRLVDGRKKV
jgi:hypothetical protein